MAPLKTARDVRPCGWLIGPLSGSWKLPPTDDTFDATADGETHAGSVSIATAKANAGTTSRTQMKNASRLLYFDPTADADLDQNNSGLFQRPADPPVADYSL